MIFTLINNAQNMCIEVINLSKLYSNAGSIFYTWILEEGIYEDYNIILVSF